MKKNTEPYTSENVGARLKQIRLAYNLRPLDVADKLGLSRSQWALYESGDRRISIERAIKLADLFKVTLDWVYRGIEDGLQVRTLRRLQKPVDSWDAVEEDTQDDG